MTQTGADLLVVGGGLLGLSIAYLAARKNYHVLVCRLSDAARPQADTLRNQSWLQSGLRYIGALDTDERTLLAKEMLAGGFELHDELGIPRPTGFGIVRLADDAEGRKLERDAERMGVDVMKLENEPELRGLLGEFYAPESVYYATPEIPFDEPMLLRRLREGVKDARGVVQEIRDPIELNWEGSGESRAFSVMVDGRKLSPPPLMVLAAGAGNAPLVDSMRLDAAVRLQLYRTPLLVVPTTVMRRVRIFQDKVREFSVVSHPPSDNVPSGAMVVGTIEGTPTEFCRAHERRIPRADSEHFWRIDCLRRFQSTGRFTAGFEIAADGKRSVYPWIAKLSSNVLAAVPGRATLCMRVSRAIVEDLAPAAPATWERDIGVEWNGPIYMHHTYHYEALNDLADTDQA